VAVAVVVVVVVSCDVGAGLTAPCGAVDFVRGAGRKPSAASAKIDLEILA
jgi:hypothetical protein